MVTIECYIEELQKGLKECLEDIQKFYEKDIKFHNKEDAIKYFRENYKYLLKLI